jgi:NADP-dependent 3-hydroxy acid dehydrogenase YdfG
MTRTILITGTSTGFGRETAERLARDGYRVFAAMRDVIIIGRMSMKRRKLPWSSVKLLRWGFCPASLFASWQARG